MIVIFKKLIQNRELIAAFTFRNIELKYKQTFLGILWALFMPIVIILSGAIVRIAMAKMAGRAFEFSEILSVCVKAIPWTFFVISLKFSVGSLVSNMHILQKTNCSRVIFPVSYVLSQFFDFVVAAGTFAVVALFLQLQASWYLLWLPVIIIILFLFILGWAMLLSAANLFYRDVRHIVDVILTFGIFFTPVFFDADLFNRGRIFLLLNPMGSILEAINAVTVLHKPPAYGWLIYSVLWAYGSFMLGWKLFHKVEPVFAEKI